MALEVERPQKGRDRSDRMDGRAFVVEQPGQSQLAGPRAAAYRLRGFENGHLDALARKRHCRCQPVGAGADDDRAAHSAAATDSAVLVRPPMTSTGNSQDSSSHGPRLRISATSTQPSSSSPDAAS